VNLKFVRVSGTFADLFVTQPYAPALELLPEIRYVVDLGANRGLFPLYVLHYLHNRGKGKPHFVCVEAAQPNYERLLNHVHVNALTESVVPICGAVCGRRSGSVYFNYPPRWHSTGSITTVKRFTTSSVPVIDLAKVINAPEVDLLKMDIEGAEQQVLEEYPEVLRRTRVLVIEFHQNVDYARCRSLLEQSGLIFLQTDGSIAGRCIC